MLIVMHHSATDEDIRKVANTMALASVVVGAHGVMVEVHPEPERASSDGPQSLHFSEFKTLLKQLRELIGFPKSK